MHVHTILIQLKINLMGEEGQDGGGPRREFFRLFADEMKSSMCIGRNGQYVLMHDVSGLQVNMHALTVTSITYNSFM